MSEGTMAIVKPEMKSYIWVQTADGSIQQVEEEVAMFCPMICREVLQTGMGSSKNYAISLPQRVNPAVLGLILDYCRFHQLPGRSNKERKTFDEKFVRLDTKKLCELTSAADSLQLRPLVDLTSRALARMIEGKTPEEIRETFNLPDDLTEYCIHDSLENLADILLAVQRSMDTITTTVAAQGITLAAQGRASERNYSSPAIKMVMRRNSESGRRGSLSFQFFVLRRDKLEIEVMVSTHDLGVYGLASMSDCAAIICSTDIAGKLKIEE
ncbi:hypothetical protein TEA_022508 [Camellia sinensis var. sinensis]|uniref:SKP1 component dimerisation domain-containing protein n=1 Tax=Camellia sinensis var. sinensis TaxID=542762 RepID=A0A4S4EPN8_CAMSN|nr:hypothetical protein TEA_022508 [Camellia sinensis var. sinensis]